MSAGNDSPSLFQSHRPQHLTSSPLTTISIHQLYPDLPRARPRNDSSSKARPGKRAVCSATPSIACGMPYLAGDESWVGSLRRNLFSFARQRPTSPDRHQRPPNCPPRHTTSRSSASIEQISIAHRCVDLPQSKGFWTFSFAQVRWPPAPIPVPRRNSPERSVAGAQILRTLGTDTAYHVAFLHWHHESSCFAFVSPLVRNVGPLSIKRQPGGHRGWGGATAPSQQVLCAHPNHIHLHQHTGSRWISSHWKSRAPNVISSIDPGPK